MTAELLADAEGDDKWFGYPAHLGCSHRERNSSLYPQLKHVN